MARQSEGTTPSRPTTPTEFPRITPPELVPTTDNLYIVHQIGKWTQAVERLISDVEAQDEKLDKLTHQASFIKGGLAVAGVVFSAVTGILYYLVNAKWDSLLQAIQPLLDK